MRIGIDFDDVVADSGIAIIEAYNKNHGASYKKEDFKHYHFQDTWGIPREEGKKEIDDFFATDQVGRIGLVPGAMEGIQTLKKRGHELYVVTGRQEKDVAQTEIWIKEHFPEVFAGVHYTSLFVEQGKYRKKSEICKELGIEVIVDDNPNFVLDCAEAGMRVLLFEQPWNREETFPGNVIRVSSWDEVLKEIG